MMSGITTMIGGGTGPAAGTSATTCTPGPWYIERMYQALEELPINFGLLGKGNASLPAAARRADRSRRHGPEAARRLGHDAGRHRQLPERRREVRHPGGDPHRHAQRVRVSRRHAGRVQGPRHPHLSHRGRGRRPRARHHQGLRRVERAAVVHQSDASLHGEHRRRASRHAHGVPSPRSGHRRGRGVRRIAHPPRDHRGRRHPARSRRDVDDLLGLAGHGPHR